MSSVCAYDCMMPGYTAIASYFMDVRFQLFRGVDAAMTLRCHSGTPVFLSSPVTDVDCAAF